MGVQFWWFYDVIAVAAVLVCVFLTVKRGLMKAAISLVGYVLAVVIALSASSSVANSFYEGSVRTNNIKKLDYNISNGDFYGDLATYLNNLGYDVYVDQFRLEAIGGSDEDIDNQIYTYLNNINNRVVAPEGIFMEKLHEGYAAVISDLIKKQLSEYSAEYAAEQIRNKPTAIYKYMKLVKDPDYKTPAAELLVDTYLEKPYKTQVRLVCLIFLLVVFIVITIFVETIANRRDHIEASLVTNVISGLIGIAKGAVVVFLIAVMVRLYVVLGSNKMLFFNHEAIDNSYIFKYVYSFVADM
ncbi:MAG: CvpA family protein [Ruminococcus sp.]|uniref:hypothetical protein n=1 Tax=Ruminococcus sp. TaxID=41978 RepID=UPI0025CFDF17|nr:hypothetical protein [Ruminococcus sp.]MCR5600509.1 CvpA family protein [Ruminococcus sp.]